MAAAVNMFSLQGQGVVLDEATPANTGSFSLQGQSVGLHRTAKLAPVVAPIAVTGRSVALQWVGATSSGTPVGVHKLRYELRLRI